MNIEEKKITEPVVSTGFGDINKDGKNTAADSRLILRYAAGLEDFDDENIFNADYNGDGNITAADARSSLRVSAGLDTLPIQNTPTSNNPVTPDNPVAPDKAQEEKSEVDILIDKYLDEYQAIGDFVYDANNPLSQYYDRKYRNAALLNQQSAFAAGSGGYSSVKQALANNAYNQTISHLGDVQAQLYQLAMDAYQQKRSDARENLEMARALKNDELNEDYQKWTIENTQSEQERNQANIEADRALNNASLAASYGNYDALSKITGLDFSNQKNRDAFNDAYAMYQATGSLTGFKDLDIDTSYLESERTKEQAILAASYGDYSGLKNLGIDTSKITKNEEIQFALYLAEFGDYSRLEELLGGDLSNAAYANKLETGLAAAQAGDYSKLEEIGFDTTYIKKLNNLKLQSGSSGSGGGGGGIRSSGTMKYISQSNIDEAIEAYNVGGEDNLAYYLQKLAASGYTDEQIYSIATQVLPNEDISVDTGTSNGKTSSSSKNSIASELAKDRFAPSMDIWSVIDHLKGKK